MRKFTLAGLALLAVLMVAGCQPNGGTTEPATGTTGTVEDTKPDKAGGKNADSSGVMYAASFDEAMKAAEKDGKLVMVKFTAEWCGPCHKMRDDMKETDLSSELANVIPVEVDIDKEPEGKAVTTYLKPPRGGIPFLVIVDSKGKELANYAEGWEGKPEDMTKFKAWLAENAKA